MQSTLSRAPDRLVVLGTGGTIAGTAAQAGDHTGYTAAQLGIRALLAPLPGLDLVQLDLEQVAQVDSKDMDHATWARLADALRRHLGRPEVRGIVVTHGTDTLEETAWFLQRVLAPAKPVVLTAAMRPATAASPDGPQNLLDAVAVARCNAARGVVAVLAGRIHGAADLRKLHGYRVDAFGSGDAGPVGLVENGQVRTLRDWPGGTAHAAAGRLLDGSLAPQDWPAVDIVTSHAGARSAVVDALVAAGARGLVIAGTGNGTVHARLEAAVARAQAAGVAVRRTSRCLLGGVVDGLPGSAEAGEDGPSVPSAGAATPVQARIELMLDLALR